MTHQEYQQPKLLKLLRDNWFLVILLAGLIAGWANFQNADANAEKRLDSLENKTQSIDGIQVQLSQIQTDLQWIKLTLSNKVQTK